MAFDGPVPVDYRNVGALNRAYLHLLQADSSARHSLRSLPQSLIRRMTGLTRHQLERLSAVPFLLLSFRERDDSLWDRILSDEGNRDLLAKPMASDLDRLLSAGLGFVWQLARQNPYTLRLTCGASLHWCERIAERTFLGLLAAAAPYPELIELRRGGDRYLWQKLLADGISRDREVRNAAHMCGLQAILTRPAASVQRSWPAAACRSRPPGLKVADE